jgi:hypothetical protein
MAYEQSDNPLQLGQVDISKTGLHPDLRVFNTYLTRMYGWTNNTQFYSIIPQQWRQYYWHNIQPWLEWANGYSTAIHSTAGLIPTRTGFQIIRLLTDLVMSGGYYFDGANTDETTKEALTFLREDWSAKKFDLNNFLYKAFTNSLSGGTTLLVANQSEKDIWLESIRVDRYLVNTDPKNNVREVKIFTDLFEQQISGFNSVSTQVKNWFLIEQRFYEDGQPFVQYVIQPQEGLVNSKSFMSPVGMKGMEWKFIPDEVKESFKAAYGDVKINVKVPLKFKNGLGCWLLKNTSASQTVPDIRFGEGQLVAAIPHLLTYDKMYTDMINDQYIAKGKILIPKTMNPNDNFADGLDHTIITKVPYSNLDQRPESIQFDSRIEMWEQGLDMILKRIADSVGLSISVVSSSLTTQASRTSKTAREISAESDKTANTIASKRELANPILDDVINTVLAFYGFEDSRVKLRFSRTALTNIDNLTVQTIRKWREGLISIEQAIKELNPDWSQAEVEAEINVIKDDKMSRLDLDFYQASRMEELKAQLIKEAAAAKGTGPSLGKDTAKVKANDSNKKLTPSQEEEKQTLAFKQQSGFYEESEAQESAKTEGTLGMNMRKLE